mgnify:CR=1 FL=1
MTEEEKAQTGMQVFMALIQDSQDEYEQLQKELKEIDVLIWQSATEVEKLTQRNAQMGAPDGDEP